MSNSQNIDQFFEIFRRRIQEVKQRLPEVIGTEAVSAAMDNFKSESYFGEQWPARKNKRNRRKLLVQTGQLKRSIRLVRSQPGLIVIGSDVPYASIHNNGGTIDRASRSETFVRNRKKRGVGKGRFSKGTKSGSGMTFKRYSISMPKRQFIGAHPKLRTRLEQTIKEEFELAFK